MVQSSTLINVETEPNSALSYAPDIEHQLPVIITPGDNRCRFDREIDQNDATKIINTNCAVLYSKEIFPNINLIKYCLNLSHIPRIMSSMNLK